MSAHDEQTSTPADNHEVSARSETGGEEVESGTEAGADIDDQGRDQAQGGGASHSGPDYHDNSDPKEAFSPEDGSTNNDVMSAEDS